MKLKRFNENNENNENLEEELEREILTILLDYVSTKKFYDDIVIDTNSLEDSTTYIIDYLKQKGLLTLALAAEKYNL